MGIVLDIVPGVGWDQVAQAQPECCLLLGEGLDTQDCTQVSEP